MDNQLGKDWTLLSIFEQTKINLRKKRERVYYDCDNLYREECIAQTYFNRNLKLERLQDQGGYQLIDVNSIYMYIFLAE